MEQQNQKASFSVSIGVFSAILLTLVIAFLELIFQDELSLSILYLVPVLLAAGTGGLRAGVFLALIASAFIFVVRMDWLQWLDPSRNDLTPEARSIIESLVHFSVFLLAAFAVTGYRFLSRKAVEQTRVDTLTGLYNRQGFLDLLAQELRQDRRYGHPVSVLSFDVNHLKKVNEEQGEGVGNLLLQTVARTAKKVLRSSDIVARVGGDEFMVLFSESGEASIEGARKLQDKLHKILDRNSWPARISMGHITFEKAPGEPEKLFNLADQLLQKAKASSPGSIEHETMDGPEKDPLLPTGS